MRKNNMMKKTIAAFMICLGFATTAAPAFAMEQLPVDHLPQVMYCSVRFDYSSTSYLTEADLYGLTKDEIQECINDIYARHGYIFKDSDIRAHYESMCWYHGTCSDMETAARSFNSVEKANVQLLVSYKDKAPAYTSSSGYRGDNNYTNCFPDTSTTLITQSDLCGFTRDEIQMLINNIYARHGYIFKDPDLRAYYESQCWYTGRYYNMEDAAATFNSVERQNIATMKSIIG